ncbi:hypothetical protein ES708_32604 [subsurface metagenome]
MPIRLVVLPGDALVTDVKAGKTFFRDNKAAEKTGTMPTKAIVAGAETYEEGYHAGDAGGLSAIDTDLAPANIKEAVNIFGKVGTLEAAPTITEAIAAVAAKQSGATAWITFGSQSIPASAIHIIARVSGGKVGAGDVEVQVLYNGVQKAYAIDVENEDGIHATDQWNGAGLGSTADLLLQYRASQSFITTYASGGGWYVT